MSTSIRPETPADLDAIRRVNRRAFGQDAEARLVDALRAGGHVRLSLVAQQDGQVVGHILLGDLAIVTDAGTVPALALAPLAVLPEYQNQGIGSALTRRGLEVCTEEGHRIVVVLGHPHFYQRFGFSSKLAAPLDSPFSGRDSFLALELAPGALEGVSGRVVYPPPFKAALQIRPARAEARSGPAPALNLLLVPGTLAVCRLDGGALVPSWAAGSDFCSITRTADELSIVCRQDRVPQSILCERGWRCLRVAGTVPFSTVGVLASLTGPLARAGISVFALSTFDTDYLLVREKDLEAVVDVLRGQGHTVGSQPDP
jgi:putative acetyltransferase